MVNYPNSQPVLTDPTAGQLLSQPSHALLHREVNDEIEAIAAELGLNPSGGFASVGARIGAVEIAVNLWQLNGNNIEPATLNNDLDFLLGNINSASMTSDLFTTTNNGLVDAYNVNIASTLDFQNTGGIQNLQWLSDNSLLLGDDFDTDKTFFARNGDANNPAIRYNATDSEWEFSNDGLIFTQFDNSTTNAVIAAVVLTANAITVGDTGVRDIVSSGVSIDGLNNITGVNDITMAGDIIGLTSLSLTDISVTNPTTFNGVAFTWPAADGLAGQALTTSGAGVLSWSTPAGAGNVTTSAITDNRLVRGDGGTTGIQESGITIDDSDNVSGIGSLASGAITSTGTLTINSLTYTFPAAHGNSGDQLSNNGAGVLTWSATGSSTVFPDNTFRIQDDADATSQLAFSVGAIATTTTRTITMPDANVDLTFLDQDVGNGSSPTLDGANITGVDAVNVDIADSGAIITATNVEAALQENRTAIDLNTSKVTNATHTGEVTGATVLTLDSTAITNKASATVASGDTVLISDLDDSGNLKEVTAQSIADLGGGGTTLANAVAQAAHGFSVNDWVYNTGGASSYGLADASATNTAESIGIVSAVADVNNFTVQFGGRITGLVGLTAGVAHFLSETAGAITATAPAPSSTGAIVKQVLVADSTTSGFIFNMRGSSYRQSFVNADLTAGVLTVTHSFDEKFVNVAVYNNSDNKIIPDEITLTDTNNLDIDLSGFGTLTGTWNLVILI